MGYVVNIPQNRAAALNFHTNQRPRPFYTQGAYFSTLQKSWTSGYLETWNRSSCSLAPTKREAGTGGKTTTRPEYVGKARDYEMDFPLTPADCAGAGLYVFTKRTWHGSSFIRLLQ